jgi:hypothetical protein
MPSHEVPDQVEIAFDDQRAAASAGLLLPATLAERLGIEQVTDQVVELHPPLDPACNSAFHRRSQHTMQCLEQTRPCSPSTAKPAHIGL